MGLFNFTFAPTITGTTAASTSAADATQPAAPQVIELVLNEESVTVPLAEAAGRTIEQLFGDYADELGDVDRVSRYVAAGRIVNGTDIPEAGVIYRGAIASESKG